MNVHAHRPLAVRIPSRFAVCLGLTGLAVLVGGCASGSAMYGIQQWGGMREVLGEGRSQGRVDLASFSGQERIVGVGALATLSGEVLIVDGDVWTSRVDADGTLQTARFDGGEDRATLLVTGEVDAWQSIPISSDVAPGEWETFLSGRIREAGLDPRKPVPFKVSGPLTDLELHVVSGSCPMAAKHGRSDAPVRPPFRHVSNRSEGQLVGFLAIGSEGKLTHHGSIVHMHVLTADEPPIMGHVDRVGVARGSVLYLPGT